MTQITETTAASTETANQAAIEAARAEGAKSEQKRAAGIREAVLLGGLDARFADTLVERSELTPAAAGMEVLRELAKRGQGTETRSVANIQTISDEADVFGQRLGNAIRLRANPGLKLEKPELEAAREFRGMTHIDMARLCIERARGSTKGMSRREIAVAALNLDSNLMSRSGMSTSDFPNILANTITRTLRRAYEIQPRTFTGWARQSTAPDFRQVARVQLSELPALTKVQESGEYKQVAFSESAEKYSLVKYGNIVNMTWEMLVNDDLGAFDRVPMALAGAAAALESDLVYACLLGNLAMSDSVALFHATHGNLAASGAAITDVTLSAGRAAMRKQTGLGGVVLNLTPSFLIVGPDSEGAANKYTSSQFVAAKSLDINPAYNTSLEVIVDARITGNDWYLAATPSLVDTIEYSYLEGETGLYTEQRVGFEVDGLQIKARHVFAAKAIDWRGLYKNPGA